MVPNEERKELLAGARRPVKRLSSSDPPYPQNSVGFVEAEGTFFWNS